MSVETGQDQDDKRAPTAVMMWSKVLWTLLFVTLFTVLLWTHEMNKYMDSVNQQLQHIQQRLDADDSMDGK